MNSPFILKPKKVTETSNYLLEVVDTEPKKRVQKGKTRGGFFAAKKILVALLLGIFMVTGAGTAAVANTASPEKANAVDLFNPGTWLCPYKDNPGAYLGGVSNTVDSGFSQAIKDPVNGKGFNISIQSSAKTNPYITSRGLPRDGVRWTALEQYGYFAPSFEGWKGVLYEKEYGDSGVWPFVGTGGKGAGGIGQIVGIADGAKSPMLNDSAGSCVGNAFEGIGIGFNNGIFSITKFLTMLAGESYGMAINANITNPTSPLYGLATGVEDLISGSDKHPDRGLKNLLYLDWLVGVLFIATFWLLWVGIVKRSFLAAGQGIIWMIGASIGGLILITNPLLVPGFIDDVVTGVNGSVTSVILPADSSSSDICEVGSKGNAGDNSIRQVKCSLWYMTVYTPWVKGQFGVNEYDLDKDSATTKWMYQDASVSERRQGSEAVKGGAVRWNEGDLKGSGFEDAKEAGIQSNLNSSRGVFSKANIRFGDYKYKGDVNWALYMMDRQNNWEENRGEDYSEIAFNQLVVNKNATFQNAGDSFAAASMSVFSGIGPTVLMIFLSFTLIALQLSMLFLIALSPLFFLVGVAPGWGRRIAMRWLELVVGILLKRIIITLFLVLFLQIYFLIVRAEIDWWIQSIIIFVLSIVAYAQRNKVTGIFNDAINFGGNRGGMGGNMVRDSFKQVGREAVSAKVNTQKAIKGTGRAASYVATRGRPKKRNDGTENSDGTNGPKGPGGSGPGTSGTGGSGNSNRRGGPTGGASPTGNSNDKPVGSSPSPSAPRPGETRDDYRRRQADERETQRQNRRTENLETRREKWENKRPLKRSGDIRKKKFIQEQDKLHQARLANKTALSELEQKKKDKTISTGSYAKEKMRLYAERQAIKNQTKKSRTIFDRDWKKIEAKREAFETRTNTRFDRRDKAEPEKKPVTE